MVWVGWQTGVRLAKRAGCDVVVVDDFSGVLRWNCHWLAVRLGKQDVGQWYLTLPTHARLRGRVPSIKVLGFGVLWDRRPDSVRRVHWLRPHFDNQERLFMQLLSAALVMGYTRPNYG